MAEPTKLKVLLVDDHPIVRKGLSEIIKWEKDMIVCGEAENSYTALSLFEKLQPDISIVDISLGSENGLELIKDIIVRYPNALMLVVSMHKESLYAERALRAGAKGYIMKHECTDKIINAIRKIIRGDIFVSDKIAVEMLNKFISGSANQSGSFEVLTDRELQVLEMIAEGHSTRKIADLLSLSPKTIETYKANIKDKLNLKSSSELMKYAIHWQLDEQQH
jgi:DNA-binding NarL/FixJ family response regulator